MNRKRHSEPQTERKSKNLKEGMFKGANLNFLCDVSCHDRTNRQCHCSEKRINLHQCWVKTMENSREMDFVSGIMEHFGIATFSKYFPNRIYEHIAFPFQNSNFHSKLPIAMYKHKFLYAIEICLNMLVMERPDVTWIDPTHTASRKTSSGNTFRSQKLSTVT